MEVQNQDLMMTLHTDDGSNSKSRGSRRERIKKKLHIHSRGDGRANGSRSLHTKLSNLEDFAGIALVTIISAEMRFKDKWLACISIGEQTFRTEVSEQTMKPQWNSEKKFVLERNGPHVAKISVFETNRLSKNHLIGYCEVDLFDFLSQDSGSVIKITLSDPSQTNGDVGNISLSCSIEDPIETEKSFARRILVIVDYNGDGQLSLDEFSQLIDVFGNQHAEKKKVELFKAADENGDGVVSMDELATLLAVQQEKEPLINNCPVCGELLDVSDKLNSMIHMSLCFDEGTGNQIMTGGFLTDKQASYGWMFKLSEWAHVSSYDAGLNSGSNASHIVVFDRKKKRLVEEIIDGKIVLSMRAIYQSKVGLGIMDKELKPGARPVAHAGRDDVAVCAADCRLIAFNTVEESLRFWIKFSLRGLLGDIPCSDTFNGGTLVIFRLAPQDYHRFHFPVSGKIEQIVNTPGCLYTVNPIAVNSKYCNVFTENKRAVSIISTEDFGKVAFVAIGATMVGSITFTKKKGDYVQKGDEFGYFSFGGSTVICVFEKDSIAIDQDLLSYSARSIETLVSVGMQLGVSVRKRAELPLPDIKNLTINTETT
ncbi:hypothetical protein M8C21_022061, partial [Ambrosia artemisiifolia]